MVFLSQDLFLYATYELVQIFRTPNRTDYLCLNKLASMDKELCLFIYIRCRRLEESHFPIHL